MFFTWSTIWLFIGFIDSRCVWHLRLCRILNYHQRALSPKLRCIPFGRIDIRRHTVSSFGNGKSATDWWFPACYPVFFYKICWFTVSRWVQQRVVYCALALANLCLRCPVLLGSGVIHRGFPYRSSLRSSTPVGLAGVQITCFTT